MTRIICPICLEEVSEGFINEHIDSTCTKYTGTSSQCTIQSKLSTSLPKGDQDQVAVPLSSPSIIQKRHKRASPESHPIFQSTQTTNKRSKREHVSKAVPLTEVLRPTTLSEFIGQQHVIDRNSWLMATIASGGSFGSIIFWGPPGSGKTTLARLLANENGSVFKEVSAALVGINEVRPVLEESKKTLFLSAKRTVLFMDEIHRFNKTQQDMLLPYIERGHVQLIGATTENPSFKLTAALLSRCRLYVFEHFTDDDMKTILLNAANRVAGTLNMDEPENLRLQSPGISAFPQLTTKVLSTMISLAAGDARTGISLLEHVLKLPNESTEATLLAALKQSISLSYDRTGDDRYDMISALHKSIRGGNGSAAMYWLARMLVAGEDPLYIARRLVVCASEDIGLADPHALPLAVAALQACQVIGMPECRINLAHVVAYLSEASKSTRAYEAYKRAEDAVRLDMTITVPLSMRNAPTKMMENLGYGRSYRYNPDYAHPVHNTYLPAQLEGARFLREHGDITGKIWDEGELARWEEQDNSGRQWEGRCATVPLRAQGRPEMPQDSSDVSPCV